MFIEARLATAVRPNAVVIPEDADHRAAGLDLRLGGDRKGDTPSGGPGRAYARLRGGAHRRRAGRAGGRRRPGAAGGGCAGDAQGGGPVAASVEGVPRRRHHVDRRRRHCRLRRWSRPRWCAAGRAARRPRPRAPSGPEYRETSSTPTCWRFSTPSSAPARHPGRDPRHEPRRPPGALRDRRAAAGRARPRPTAAASRSSGCRRTSTPARWRGRRPRRCCSATSPAARCARLLDSLVLIVVPSTTPTATSAGPRRTNRPGQNGPAIVGRNANGQGLNLNRDYVKMEAPETRGAAALIGSVGPDRLHRPPHHQRQLPRVRAHLRAGAQPQRQPGPRLRPRPSAARPMRERMRRRHRTETFWYGNFRNQDPDSLAAGWETYDPRPRFGTNWMGLRGKIAVLSEGYSNADFRTRVTATYDFVHEVLSYLAEHRAAVLAAVEASLRQRADSVTVRSVLGPPTPQDVVAEITRPAGDGNGGYARRIRSGCTRPSGCRCSTGSSPPGARRCPRPICCRRGSASSRRCSGGRASRSRGSPGRGRGQAEEFTVDSVAVDPLFEGHRSVRVEGRWGEPGRSAAYGRLVRGARRISRSACWPRIFWSRPRRTGSRPGTCSTGSSSRTRATRSLRARSPLRAPSEELPSP